MAVGARSSANTSRIVAKRRGREELSTSSASSSASSSSMNHPPPKHPLRTRHRRYEKDSRRQQGAHVNMAMQTSFILVVLLGCMSIYLVTSERASEVVVDMDGTTTATAEESFKNGVPLSAGDCSSPDAYCPSNLSDDLNHDNEEGQCKLYMAPSSVPNAGWGMYTAVPISKGGTLGDPELVVIVPDYAEAFKEWILLDEVYWDAEVFQEVRGESVYKPAIYFPGFGALVNCHMGLNNIGHTKISGKAEVIDAATGEKADHGNAKQDWAGLALDGEEVSPGIGAFTPHYQYDTYATRKISAGEELFVDYGEDWFHDREEKLGFQVPFQKDFLVANRIMRRHTQVMTKVTSGLRGLWNKSKPSSKKSSTAEKEAEEEETEEMKTTKQDIWTFVRNSSEERVRNALPPDATNLPDALKMGAAPYTLPNYASKQMGPTWLRKHGLCLDHIYPDISTIPHAGRGAFARRALSKGSIVAPVPVMQHDIKHLHAMRRVRRDMWGPDFDTEETRHNINVNVDANPNTKNDEYDNTMFEARSHAPQLLLNYCYGHPESSMVLLPYAPTVNFINHAPHESDTLQPNVALRWSNAFELARENLSWLEQPTDQVLKKSFGLLMELVALRDIAPGEEILLDYGSDWDEAWQDHVRIWKRVGKSFDTYITAKEMNELEEVGVLRTFDEQAEEPYPRHLHTACAYQPEARDSEDDQARQENENKEKEGLGVEEVVLEYSRAIHRGPCLRPCTIVEREEEPSTDGKENAFSSYTYTAEMKTGYEFENDDDDDCKIPPGELHVVYGMPRYAIKFVEVPYGSLQYEEGVFRNVIGLADDVFPKAWKDL